MPDFRLLRGFFIKRDCFFVCLFVLSSYQISSSLVSYLLMTRNNFILNFARALIWQTVFHQVKYFRYWLSKFQVFTYSLTLCLSLVFPILTRGAIFTLSVAQNSTEAIIPESSSPFPFPPMMMHCQIVSALIVPMSFSSLLPLSSSFLDSVLLSSPSSPQKLGQGFSNVSDALLWQLPRCLV